MTRILPNPRWEQTNESDKFGSLWASRNINLDKEGYIRLSRRMVNIADSTTTNFGLPVAIGKYAQGAFQVTTDSNANFVVEIETSGASQIVVTEDTGTSNPTTTTRSHGKFFQGRWFVSTATAVLSKVSNGAGSAAWTSSGISFTTGVRHYMEVFASRNSLCVTNANKVQQYTNSAGTLTNTVDLTIPSEFDCVGLAYNYGKMGVITRASEASNGEVTEAKFYLWDGSTTSATGYGLSSDAGIAIAPYKSSFVVLTRSGQLKYFTGGGFQDLASFPFFFGDEFWGASGDYTTFGDSMFVDGDVIYINIGFLLNAFGRRREQRLVNLPSGIWCFDPKVGLYHRNSPSLSTVGVVSVSAGGTDTGTDILTAAAGTIPATGNKARYVLTAGTGITGISLYQDYYIIKLSSTTFALATSKANALLGTKIDLTAADSGTSYFLMYTLSDYGQSLYEDAGGLNTFGESTHSYRDLICGADLYSTALVSLRTLCITDPFLDNRGAIILPKISSEATQEKSRTLTIRFKPLDTDDMIVVKEKHRDIFNVPIGSPNGASTDEFVWTSDDEGYTTSDLSEAKTYFDAGGELELELTAGVGAGTCVKVTNIETDGTTYNLTLAESVIGATGALKSHFILDNWRTIGTITSDDNNAQFKDFNVGKNGIFTQFKIELRGLDTTIHDILIDNVSFKK